MADIPKHYWDAAMWIGLINREKRRIQDIQYFYDLAQKKKAQILTSTITFVEVFRLHSEQRTEKPLPPDTIDIFEKALRQDCVTLITLDMEVAQSARNLRRELADFEGAADAIHLASALRWSAEVMLTYDAAHLLAQSNKLRCRAGHLLPIVEPQEPKDDIPLLAKS